MPILRATAVLNHRSGVNKDASRNVWHFSSPQVLNDQDVASVGVAVGSFYSGNIRFSLGGNISPAVDAHRVELADIDEGNPGAGDDVASALRGSIPFTTPGVGGGDGDPSWFSLPNEVCAVLSFEAAAIGVPEEQGLIRPRARRRGRIFIGPLNAGTLNERDVATREPQINDGFKEDVLDAYDTLLNSLLLINPQLTHDIYSRSDGIARPVVRAWINNEFDTQRRRGIDPADRFERTINQGVLQAARAGVEVAEQP